MSGRIASGFLLIGLLLALAACGGGQTSTTTTPPQETTKLRVYFLQNGKVQPVSREVTQTQAVLTAAMEELLVGPTNAERGIGLTSGFAPDAKLLAASVANGVATIVIGGKYTNAGLAQLVYTATQFPTVHSVASGQRRLTRTDFEDSTPLILVESPLPFETVGNPLHATGTANTFEATFQYDVVEPEGRIVDSHFVTATSGSGQRGTFDFTTKPYETSRPGLGELVVYELSAKDGSRIHIVEIPVRMR